MEYTTQKIESSRRNVKAQQIRVARQRAKVVQALADRHPADEMQARLLIMEQSLIAMTRFLKILERDIKEELSLHGYQTQKRIKDRRKAPRVESVEQAADRFASRATASVLSPDDDSSLETLARGMRPLTGR